MQSLITDQEMLRTQAEQAKRQSWPTWRKNLDAAIRINAVEPYQVHFDAHELVLLLDELRLVEAREENLHEHYRGEHECRDIEDACWGCTLRDAEEDLKRFGGHGVLCAMKRGADYCSCGFEPAQERAWKKDA